MNRAILSAAEVAVGAAMSTTLVAQVTSDPTSLLVGATGTVGLVIMVWKVIRENRGEDSIRDGYRTLLAEQTAQTAYWRALAEERDRELSALRDWAHKDGEGHAGPGPTH